MPGKWKIHTTILYVAVVAMFYLSGLPSLIFSCIGHECSISKISGYKKVYQETLIRFDSKEIKNLDCKDKKCYITIAPEKFSIYYDKNKYVIQQEITPKMYSELKKLLDGKKNRVYISERNTKIWITIILLFIGIITSHIKFKDNKTDIKFR